MKDELDRRLSNLLALPEDAVHEKLLHRLILKTMLSLYPELTNEDIIAECKKIQLDRDLLVFRGLIEKRNRMKPGVFHHFQVAERSVTRDQGRENVDYEGLLRELKTIEDKLWKVDLLRLRELTRETTEVADLIRNRQLILLAEEDITISPTPTIEHILLAHPLPTSLSLSIAPLTHPHLFLGRLPTFDSVESDLNMLNVVKAVQGCSEVVLVQVIDKRLEDTTKYIERICGRITGLGMQEKVVYVFRGYEGEEEGVRKVREKVKMLLAVAE